MTTIVDKSKSSGAFHKVALLEAADEQGLIRAEYRNDKEKYTVLGPKVFRISALSLLTLILAALMWTLFSSHGPTCKLNALPTNSDYNLVNALLKRQRYFQYHEFKHSTIQGPEACTLVVSSGGVASTEVIKNLYKFNRGCRLSAKDDDGLKHLPLDQLAAFLSFSSPGRVGRILYIYDHPALSVMSLFRRGYAQEHCYKLRDDDCAGLPSSALEYAKLGDYFHFQDHIDSYLHGNPASLSGMPVGSLRMSEFQTYLKDVIQFLGVDGHLFYTRMHTLSIGVSSNRTQKYSKEPAYHELSDNYDRYWKEVKKRVPGFTVRTIH